MAERKGSRPQRRTRNASKEKEEPTAVEAAPVEIEIENLSAIPETINWLLYGPEGQGKTLLAGFAPNAVFLSTEIGGAVSAKRAGSQAEMIRCPDWEHALSGVRWADKELGPNDFLIVDSHTRMQVEYLRWLLRMRHAENTARDLDIPALADHQKWQNAFTRWTDHIVAAQYNAIFIATDMIKENEEGDDIVMPSFLGRNYAIAKYIAAQMNIVSYYSVSGTASTDDNTVRRALFQPYPPWIAKDRYGVLGKFQDVNEKEYDKIAEWIDLIQESA
jgi:hypothetical protein